MELHPAGEEPEDVWTNSRLWPAIEKLPKKQRTVIILRTFQQLPYREVGEIMGITENSAKVNFHHAIKNLKDELGDEE